MNATRLPSSEIAALEEGASAFAPVAPVAREMSVVVCAAMSRTYTSLVMSLSLGLRGAVEENATKRPAAEIAVAPDLPLPTAPALPEARVTSVVVACSRSRT